ncbi:MAG: hypothetical protein LBU60_02270 [Clostridiales bacterium]|jgi:hypothetical protein|nr:hypothetical protein [Clostridiales bacterium]
MAPDPGSPTKSALKKNAPPEKINQTTTTATKNTNSMAQNHLKNFLFSNLDIIDSPIIEFKVTILYFTNNIITQIAIKNKPRVLKLR